MAPLRALLLIAALSTAGFAQGRGRGNDKNDKADKHVVPPGHVRQTYTIEDRRSDARVITTWYRAHPGEYHPVVELHRTGLIFAPGYETRIVRAQVLPSPFRTYVRPVPVVLVSSLPPVRPGWEYVMLDNQILLVERPTWKVVDIVVRL